MHTFPKTGAENMKVYYNIYIIPLNYRLARHSENFKTKLYHFQED